MAVCEKREPGTYIVFGTDGSDLIRLPPGLKARAETIHQRLGEPAAIGKVIGALVGLGAEVEARIRRKPPRTGVELLARHDRPLKQEVLRLYRAAYAVHPGPGIGRWVAYLLEKGLERFEAGG